MIDRIYTHIYSYNNLLVVLHFIKFICGMSRRGRWRPPGGCCRLRLLDQTGCSAFRRKQQVRNLSAKH